MRRVWPVMLLLAAAECRGSEPAPPAVAAQAGPERITAVALVDSVAFDAGPTSGVLHRVEVQLSGRRDTIPGVLTWDPPGLLADTAVVGFSYDQDSVTGIFLYTPARRSVTRRALPRSLRDFVPAFATPSFAPDGRSFLYVAYDSGQDSVRPTLRSWPALEVMATGPGVPVGATDVPPYSTEWHGQDTAVAIFTFGGCPAPLSMRTFFVLSAETMRSDTALDLEEPVGTPHWWPWRDSVPVAIPGMRAWLVASTDGPRLGPGFVLAIRAGRRTVYADSVRDVDFLTTPTFEAVPGLLGLTAAQERASEGVVTDIIGTRGVKVKLGTEVQDIYYIGTAGIDEKDPFYAKAVEAHKAIIVGKKVLLQTDVVTQNSAGQKLAHVFLDQVDVRNLVNGRIIGDGLGKLGNFEGNGRFRMYLENLGFIASQRKMGMWAGNK